MGGKTTYSELFHITYGTAQGSCLGPLLFILFCNDMKYLPIFGKLIIFADDTTLINQHRNKKFLNFVMIHDLEIMIDWFRANQLSLDLSKSVLLYFWEKGNQTQLTVGDIEILISDSTKFLGVHIDNELRWTIHVNNLHKKLMANKFLLSMRTNLLNTNSLCLIYNAHILSHLTYGLLAWGLMASKKAIKDLASIQDSCVHLVNKVRIQMFCHCIIGNS